ncbi:MAG: BON domain-containing protein [Betaproteobacteria bacterium]|nr:BON domain-containing protein [Betaproteobacteria bacterium]
MSVALSAVITGMLALSLAACGDKPSVEKDAKDAAKTSAPPVQQPAKALEKDKVEAEKIAREKAAAAARAKEDAALADNVKSALVAEPGLKALTVDVTASDGEVTLFGSANTRANRDKATRVASKVPGVKSVKNTMAIVAGS